MDQDSSFLEENIDGYFKDILNFKGKEKVAVYGLEYSKNDINDTTENYIEVDHLITSASVMNLKLYNEIGGFDENLFIDGVDIDYCYSALSKGFKNIKFARNFFNHSLGVRSRRGSVFTLYLIKKNVSVHSSLRVYYMYRNMLYIKNKYENVIPDIIKKFVKNQKHQVNKNIKYSNEFFTVLKYKRKAISDFNNKKMGKLKNFI
jgi:rhamnosyltransferase